jgi:hypothetical protein
MPGGHPRRGQRCRHEGRPGGPGLPAVLP